MDSAPFSFEALDESYENMQILLRVKHHCLLLYDKWVNRDKLQLHDFSATILPSLYK